MHNLGGKFPKIFSRGGSVLPVSPPPPQQTSDQINLKNVQKQVVQVGKLFSGEGGRGIVFKTKYKPCIFFAYFFRFFVVFSLIFKYFLKRVSAQTFPLTATE